MKEERKRKYFLGANWKCNGTIAFAKEIVNHLINDVEYDKSKMGKSHTDLSKQVHIKTIFFSSSLLFPVFRLDGASRVLAFESCQSHRK